MTVKIRTGVTADENAWVGYCTPLSNAELLKLIAQWERALAYYQVMQLPHGTRSITKALEGAYAVRNSRGL